jgi:hypothetical protein
MASKTNPRPSPPATQGAVASRPGQAATNVLSRLLNRTILNFGFSGNGEPRGRLSHCSCARRVCRPVSSAGIMETSVAQFLTVLPASVIVIDCNPNMNGEDIAANAVVRSRGASQVALRPSSSCLLAPPTHRHFMPPSRWSNIFAPTTKWVSPSSWWRALPMARYALPPVQPSAACRSSGPLALPPQWCGHVLALPV